jgi:cytochrome c-type biogenesis protein
MPLNDIATSFVLGLLTPLAAACVLPLYPAFLSYVASQLSSDARRVLPLLGVVVTAGVILFMLLFGIVFTLIFKKALTSVIQVISPIAFAILLIVSVLLILNVPFSKIIPKAGLPAAKSPLRTAFAFGFFFGAIVIPCNPAFIIALLTQATVSTGGFLTGIMSFVAFGAGIGAPLLLFSLLSAARSSAVINAIASRQRAINLVTGIFLFLVSLYYLLVVFAIFGEVVASSILGKFLSFLFGWVGLFIPSIG